MTYMFILKCALKLVEEIILYYDARSEKHKKKIIIIFKGFDVYMATLIHCQVSSVIALYRLYFPKLPEIYFKTSQ